MWGGGNFAGKFFPGAFFLEPTEAELLLVCLFSEDYIIKGYVIPIVSPRGEFHPWVEFAPVSVQTCLSVYMFSGGEISPLPLIGPCLKDRDKTHPGGNST